jgi:hypothetical protein
MCVRLEGPSLCSASVSLAIFPVVYPCFALVLRVLCELCVLCVKSYSRAAAAF